jgi:hypothetical protein
VRNQRSKWRPSAGANHDSDGIGATVRARSTGPHPTKRKREITHAETNSRNPGKAAAEKTTQNRRIRRGARRECDEEREKQKHGESLGEAAVVAMCGRRRTEHRRFEVGRPPADGELGAASTHGHASALARLDLAGSRSRRRFRPLLHHLSLACLPATGRIRIE